MTTTDPLEQFDPFTDDVQQNPYPWYARMRSEAPVLRLPADALGRPGDHIYCVSTYELVSRVLSDWRTFSSRFGSPGGSAPAHLIPELKAIQAEGWPNPATMLTEDPPAHNRYRHLVGKAFTVRRVQSYRPAIQRICAELLTGFGDRREIEFVSEFGVPIPVRTVAFALGVPEDRQDDFKRWADQSVAPIGRDLDDEGWRDSARAVVEQQHYFADQIEQRRVEPRDDLLTDLLNAELTPEDGAEGEPLSMAEMLSIIRQLAVAGSETTTSTLTDTMLYLSRSPGEWERLKADPTRIPAVVEEALRLSSPNQGLYRIATIDTELGGVTIPKGATVWVMFASADRDETVFEDAEQFDPERETTQRHIAFGKGVHFCLGAALARLELQVALETLLDRWHSFDVLTTDDLLRYAPSYVLRGLQRLDVGFTL
jgi:cytochrome P450